MRTTTSLQPAKQAKCQVEAPGDVRFLGMNFGAPFKISVWSSKGVGASGLWDVRILHTLEIQAILISPSYINRTNVS